VLGERIVGAVTNDPARKAIPFNVEAVYPRRRDTGRFPTSAG